MEEKEEEEDEAEEKEVEEEEVKRGERRGCDAASSSTLLGGEYCTAGGPGVLGVPGVPGAPLKRLSSRSPTDIATWRPKLRGSEDEGDAGSWTELDARTTSADEKSPVLVHACWASVET